MRSEPQTQGNEGVSVVVEHLLGEQADEVLLLAVLHI